MYNEKNSFEDTSFGKIQIAPQVIEIIAKHSAIDIDGVVSLSGGFELTDLFGKSKSAAKGVRVEINESEIVINISIVIMNGYRIPELAEKIQDNVKYSVETMTDLDVIEVNIYINSIIFEDTLE